MFTIYFVFPSVYLASKYLLTSVLINRCGTAGVIYCIINHFHLSFSYDRPKYIGRVSLGFLPYFPHTHAYPRTLTVFKFLQEYNTEFCSVFICCNIFEFQCLCIFIIGILHNIISFHALPTLAHNTHSSFCLPPPKRHRSVPI